jgi:hypothetical protein
MKPADAEHSDELAERAGVRNENGFILPLTLWMIAIMGLLAATLNIWVANTVANSQALAQRTELELAQSNIRNELVYMLGTRPSSYRGIEVGTDMKFADNNDFNAILAGPGDSGRHLKLDARPYISESAPNLVISVQDGSGLLNLNVATPINLRRVLSTFDVPEPEANRLIDSLMDYIDDDDFTRLAGAERTQYTRLGLLPPTNGILVTPMQADRILGWDKLSALWEADMKAPFLTTCQAGGFNPNNAPGPVLMANIRGLTSEKTDKVLAYRSEKPFRNIREFAAAADMIITDEPFFYSFVPAPCMVVDLIDKTSGQHTRFSLTLEPTSDKRPWRVDYAIRIPSEYNSALDRLDPEAIFPAPESIDLPAGADGTQAKSQ